MARILLSAYACEPGRGSEPGVGWNWATELAHLGHDVSVITRTANRQAIESAAETRYLSSNFFYYDLPRWAHGIRKAPAGKTLYYILWQWLGARYLRKLFPVSPFDVVQHVTYVSVRFPSFMGILGIPFLFGPVSGGEAIPPLLRAGFPVRQYLEERVRDISNWLVRFDPMVRRTFRQATHILVTPDTLPLIPERWRHKCVTRLAIGLPEQYLRNATSSPSRARDGLRVLYAGRLLHWKGVDLALRVVSHLRRLHPGVQFTVVGDGPARPSLMQLAGHLGLQAHVRWLGWLPQDELAEQYRSANVLLFPSLRDSGGLAVLEALAHGVPVVCTDLGGPGLIVNDSCGHAVSTHSRDRAELVRELANALHRIASTPHLLSSLSHGAILRARQFNFRDLVLSVHPAPPARLVTRKA